jgi:hypothetical protein
VGLLTRIKAAALFGCIFFSCQSFAEDYWWSNGDGIHYTNPADGCSKDMGTDNGRPITFDRFQLSSDTGGRCMYVFDTPPRTWNGSTQVLNRRGDTCPKGTGPFDSSTGMCTKAPEPPKQPGDKCEDQSGGSDGNPIIWDDTVSKCVRFSESQGDAPCTEIKNRGGSGSAYKIAGNLDTGGNAVAPPTFADGSLNCQVQTISSSECTINVPGAISCNVIGVFTGKANPSGTSNAADALCPGGKCPVKEPLVETKEEGCVPVGNGSGGSTCTQVKETTQEGSQQCGQVNGAYKCITKQPYSNGITTNISATSQTLPDGSVKVTTVKDSSNTVCTDVKTCTVKTSTTTTTSTTKPNGSTTTGSSCKGSCTPNGGGLETNPAAGSGNTGSGTGGGGTGGNGDGEGGDGTADTTDSCAAPPPCAGDPFSCAILKQAHIDTCKLMAPPTAEQQAAADAKTNAAYAALDAQQSALDSQVNTLLGQFQGSTAGGGTGGGKCLPDFNFSVMGMTQSMEFSKVCDSISWVRLMVLAGAYLLAARIVYKEV